MMAFSTQLSLTMDLLVFIGLFVGRRLSPTMLVVLLIMLMVGNLEMLATVMQGKLDKELFYIRLESLDLATRLFNYAWLAFAGGLWLGTRHKQVLEAIEEPGKMGAWAEKAQGISAVRLYAVLFVLCTPLEFLMHGPLKFLTQLLLPFLALRFIPVFMLAYGYFREGRYGGYLLAVSLFEVIANLSFFNSFRELFAVIICAMALALMCGARARWLSAVLVAVLMVTTLSVWSFIKPEFRAFLNRDGVAQVDTRSFSEKANFALDLVQKMSGDDLLAGMATMMSRVAYNSYFAATVYQIPDYRAFGHGEMLENAVLNTFMPRFLFPEKEIIDDSLIASELTGLHVSGAEMGTSISVGLVGELYADVGPRWLLVAMLLFGIILARMEAFIFHCVGPTREALAFSAVFLGSFGTNVYSLPKFVGILFYLFLAMAVFFYALYRHIRRV